MTLREPVTGPTLLGMHSRRARLFAAIVLGAAAFSILADRTHVASVGLLLAAIAVLAAGAAGLLMVSEDPIPRLRAWAVGMAGPLATGLTCVAIPGPLANPNQLNAVGAGVAIAAFLCVRGRVGVAWCVLAAMMAIVTAWAWLTGQHPVTGLLLTVPNVAVLLMATLFAVVIRPAAAAIRRLHAQAIRESATIAATGARSAEGERQRRRLRELAGPTLALIAAGQQLSEHQIQQSALTGRQLRDAVRAKLFDAPPVVAAVRAARERGVEVRVFDELGMEDAEPALIAEIRNQAVKWLSSARDGRVTVRVNPPGREWLATIVATGAAGDERQYRLHADGTASTR